MSSSSSSVTLDTNSSSSSSIDQLVSEYVSSISQPVYQLQSQQATINSLISTYQSIKSDLTSFESQTSSLKSIGSLSPLAAKTVASSDTSVVTATAQATATSGTHSLLVTQLAKYDTLVSTQLSQTAAGISAASGSGTSTFSVTINGKTTNVNVNVNSGDSNSTVMTNIANAVNNADLGITASVINDTNSTARLVFTSTNSGSANSISVSDVTGNLMQDVGWTSSLISGRTASSSTGAGFVNSSLNSLDANFLVDGIPVTRSSNTVSDVLTGVTLNLEGLQQATDNPVTLTISPDTTAVQSTVQNFINSYNTLINTISQNMTDTTSNSSSSSSSTSSSTSGATVTRAPLAGDVTFMSLSNTLQNILMSPVSSAQNGNPNALSEIGITLNNDGTLSLNQSTFTSALTSNPNSISDLFNSQNGVAVQLDSLVKSFSQPGGVMDQEINGSQDQINSMNDMINSMQASINIQADAMRSQFTSYQSMLIQLNQTQSSLTSIWSNMSSSGLL